MFWVGVVAVCIAFVAMIISLVSARYAGRQAAVMQRQLLLEYSPQMVVW